MSKQVHSTIVTADATPCLPFTLYDEEGSVVSIGSNDRFIAHYVEGWGPNGGTAIARVLLADGTTYAITNKNTTSNKLRIDGDHEAYWNAQTHFIEEGSTGDNTLHKIVSVALVAGPETEIEVASLTDATADGTIRGHNENIDSIVASETLSAIKSIGVGVIQPGKMGRISYVPYLHLDTAGAAYATLIGEIRENQLEGVK